jgi:(2Fe-2S) ferredoxin
VECLNWCEAGTVIQVGDRYFGNVTAENVDALVDSLFGSSDYTPERLADATVKVQIRRGAAKGAAEDG